MLASTGLNRKGFQMIQLVKDFAHSTVAQMKVPQRLSALATFFFFASNVQLTVHRMLSTNRPTEFFRQGERRKRSHRCSFVSLEVRISETPRKSQMLAKVNLGISL